MMTSQTQHKARSFEAQLIGEPIFLKDELLLILIEID